jgi:SAM-dependent methyltransferase
MVPRAMTGILSPEAREALFHRLVAMYAPYFGRIAASSAHLEQMARDSADEERSLAQLEGLVAAIERPLTGMSFLEVGSGIGLTVAAARKVMKAEAYGIEPGDAEYEGTLQLSRAVLAEAGLDPEIIRDAMGEVIPFPDNYFDVVYSSNVLEHVKEPPKVISEIIRVLKPGGHAQIVVPNYGSWWEGHYGVIWFPHLPAVFGKIYVRLLGREPSFIDTLQLVTRGKLERWVAPHKGAIEIIDWGVEIWEQRVRTLGFSEYSALGRLKSILRVLHLLKVIPLLILVGKFLHWETPLILTFKKKTPAADA